MSERIRDLVHVIEDLLDSVASSEDIEITLSQTEWEQVLAILRASPSYEDRPSAT